jgi:hypothetical protein
MFELHMHIRHHTHEKQCHITAPLPPSSSHGHSCERHYKAQPPQALLVPGIPLSSLAIAVSKKGFLGKRGSVRLPRQHLFELERIVADRALLAFSPFSGVWQSSWLATP